MQSGDDAKNRKDAEPGAAELTFLHGRVEGPAGPLPRGQHDLTPEQVANHQAMRLRHATSLLVGGEGYEATTIGAIVAKARVSRRTFYDHFEHKDHCVLATYGAACACLADSVHQRYVAAEEWDAKMAGALLELARLLVEYPEVSRLCFLEIRSVGQAAEKPMKDNLAMVTDALRLAVSDCPGAGPVDDITFEMSTGGLVTVVRDRLSNHDAERLRAELPAVAATLLAPLVGHDATEAVVARVGDPSAGQAARAI